VMTRAGFVASCNQIDWPQGTLICAECKDNSGNIQPYSCYETIESKLFSCCECFGERVEN